METFRSLIPKFKQAIENEINFIQDKYRERKVVLGDGKLDSKSSLSFIYEFETSDELTIPEDSPVKIIHESVSLDGTLIKTNGNKIYIEISEYFGETIKDVTLVNDPSSFLKRLLKQFESFEKGEIILKTGVFDKLLSNSRLSDSVESNSYDYVNKLLNENQKNAVEQSLNNNFHFIWGPPGTGKTFSIAEIIYQLLSQNKKVLISSNTHKAVDGALKKLLIDNDKKRSKYFNNNDVLKKLYENQQILRLGGKKDKENKDLYGELHISMDDLVEKKSEEINSSIEKLRKEVSSYQLQISDKKELLELYETYTNYKDKKDNSLILLEELNIQKNELTEWLDINNTEIKEKSEKNTYFTDLLSKIKDEQNNIVALAKQVKKYNEILEKISEKKSKINTLEADKDSLYSRKKAIEETQKQHLSILKKIDEGEVLNSIKNLFLGINKKKTLEDLRFCEENIDKLEKRIIRINENIKNNKEKIDELENERNIYLDNINNFNDIGISRDELLNLAIYKEKYEELEIKSTKISQDIKELGYEELKNSEYDVIIKISEIILKKETEEKRLQSLEEGVKKILDNTQLLKKIETLNCKEIKLEINNNENSLKEVQSTLKDFDEKLKNIKTEIVNNAKLIGCTLTKAMMSCKALLVNPPDVVIIDEFSMVGLPLISFVSCLANTQLIFVGDHKQLPPIYMSDTNTEAGKIVKNFQGRNIYNYLFDEESNSLPETVTQLNIQFRMNDDIKEVINKLFYEGKLKSDEESTKDNYIKLPFLSDSGESVILVDTTSINPWVSREKNAKTGSRVNFYSALLSNRIIRNILDNKLASEVGYTSPYAGQCRLMNHILGDDKNKVLAATVHKFQGDEKEIIIFDLTDSYPERPSGLLKKYAWNSSQKEWLGDDSQADKIINVAISRAQKKIIVIANKKYFEYKLNLERNTHYYEEPIIELFEMFKKNKGFKTLSAEAVLNYDQKEIKDLRDSVYGKDSKLNTNNLTLLEDKNDRDAEFYTEVTFYDALAKSLDVCENKLIILSPFISINRVNKLNQNFLDLESKGIEVSIYTKPLSEQNDNWAREGVNVLKNFSNIKVFYREEMHEKAVIIDDKITFFGSLNPLSQNNSKELMLKAIDNNFSIGIMKYVEMIRDARESSSEDRNIGKISEDIALREFRTLRKIICSEKHLPFSAILHNATIESLIKKKPKEIEGIMAIDEFQRNKTNIAGFEGKILYITNRII